MQHDKENYSLLMKLKANISFSSEAVRGASLKRQSTDHHQQVKGGSGDSVYSTSIVEYTRDASILHVIHDFKVVNFYKLTELKLIIKEGGYFLLYGAKFCSFKSFKINVSDQNPTGGIHSSRC